LLLDTVTFSTFPAAVFPGWIQLHKYYLS